MLPVKEDNGLYRKFWTNSKGLPYKEGYHLGKDFGLHEGNSVYSVTTGIIIIAGLHHGYGRLNPSSVGGCIWIRHNTGEKIFYANYGHINICENIFPGKVINEGDIIGSIASFYNGKYYLPHLHFGIWNSEKRFPNNHWGYQKEANKKYWVDPLPFLQKYGLIHWSE